MASSLPFYDDLLSLAATYSDAIDTVRLLIGGKPFTHDRSGKGRALTGPRLAAQNGEKRGIAMRNNVEAIAVALAAESGRRDFETEEESKSGAGIAKRWDPNCQLGTVRTATPAAPLYNCQNTYLTAAQYNSRSANRLCTQCAAGDATCTAQCCTQITTGSACNCRADTLAPCKSFTPLACTPTLLSPQLDPCLATPAPNSAYTPPPDCPVFSATDTVTFRFSVACAQTTPLLVYLKPVAGGGYTDGTYSYSIGDRDRLAYSADRPFPPPQFRIKFFNFFRPSDNGQTYFASLTPVSPALAGNLTFSIDVDLAKVLAAGWYSGTREYPAGGRLYFEGGFWNPGYDNFDSLNTNTSFRYHLNFAAPVPRSSNAERTGSPGPPLSGGAIVGIVAAGAIISASLFKMWLKGRRKWEG